MEPDLGAHVGSCDVAHEDQRMCATEDDTTIGEGELLAEEEENSCKTIQVNKRLSSRKTKAAQIQMLKGKKKFIEGQCNF